MYVMGCVLRHASEEQKRRYLPGIASGELRMQSMAVTEPTAGTDTTKLKTVAVKKGDRYVVNGQKVFISRVRHSDLLLLLARTTPVDQVKRKSEGLSVFIVDLRQAVGNGLTVKPIRNMANQETNELFFENLEVPAENLIGEEGRGLKYILDGLNAERTLIAGECIGDGYWFIDKATAYAKERVVFDRPIGQNQGIQFPIARAYANLQAADLMRYKAAALFDAGKPCGAEANMALLPRLQRVVGSGKRLHPDPRRLRLRGRVRRRAEVPRDQALPDRADLHQPDPLVYRRARAGDAALLLSNCVIREW